MSVSYLFPPEELDLTKPSAVSPDIEIVDEPARPRRNTKAIGDLSELIVALELARAGYIVSKPVGDSFRYDLIIDDGTTLFRVQVKTGRLVGGSIRVACCSTHTHRGGPATRSYRGQIDYLGVFCPQTGDVYMVPESEMVDSYMHLRVAPTANKQDRHVRWASRFKLA